MKLTELKPRLPVTVSKSDSLRHAARELMEEDIGVVLVYEPTGFVGILSERDLARAIADEVDLDEAEVRDYMTTTAITSEASAGIDDAIRKMNDFGIRHVVMVEDGEAVGVVSMRDVLQLFGSRWPEL